MSYAAISRAVAARLLSEVTITAVVGQRVRPDLIDQDEDYPAITFRMSDAGYSPGISGKDSLPSPQFEINCWARDRDASVELADIVLAAIEDDGRTIYQPSSGDVTVEAVTLMNGRWVLAEDVDGGNKPIFGVALTFEFAFQNG